MLDCFFSLDQLLGDAFTDALDAWRPCYAWHVKLLRDAIADENNA